MTTVEAVEPAVRCTIARQRATVTLDSPENRNALSTRLIDDLHRALDEAERHHPRVIVIDHTGPAFCAGADLREQRGEPLDSAPLVRAIERLSNLDAPTIAAVNGAVRAGGIGLMAACDLVAVHPSVTFAFSEVRIGVAPAIISVPILARCGWARLAAPFLTGETFDAATAVGIGLVSQVTDDVSSTVERWCAGIGASAPGAVAATKHLLRNPGTMDEMRRLSEQLFEGDEAAEGIAAFFAKRPASWAAS